MKKLNYIQRFVFLLGTIVTLAQQTPAAVQSKSKLIVSVTAHLGNGQVIEKAAIGFKDGIITYVGPKSGVDSSTYEDVINAEFHHVYPGFIVANTTSGLVEIDAVKASKDDREYGSMNPHIRSIIAYNTESKITESLRPNGVLMGQIAPRGGTISGTSSIVQFDAWNWEDAAIKIDDGIHLNWPLALRNVRTWAREEKGPIASKKYSEEIANLKDFFTKAKTYIASERNPRNLKLEATQKLFTGSQRFYVHVSGAKEIIDAVNFSNDLRIENLVIVHGDQAHKVTDVLVKNKVPVIINRPHSLPSHNDEDISFPYKRANELTKQGVTVAIGVQGQMERMQSRNLPFYAGTCAAYGLDKEEALKLITSNAAKILGIDDIVGTLEVGKQATLFISEGDALDMRTNILTHAFIQGREISLESHQTELHKRYMDKYKLQE
jgi:imidazolonepropionase-like amidohydrolase